MHAITLASKPIDETTIDQPERKELFDLKNSQTTKGPPPTILYNDENTCDLHIFFSTVSQKRMFSEICSIRYQMKLNFKSGTPVITHCYDSMSG